MNKIQSSMIDFSKLILFWILTFSLLLVPLLRNQTSPVEAADVSYEWAKGFGSAANNEDGVSVVVDSEGNSYTTGTFLGTADFDPGAGTYNLVSNGWYDIFVLKLDVDGNFVWAKSIGNANFDFTRGLSIDSDDNIYSTGYFDGTLDADPGAGTSNLVSAGGNDPFIIKLDSDGNFIWGKNYGGSGGDNVEQIVIDSNGNIYAAGYFDGTADFDPGAGTANLTTGGPGGSNTYVLKLDSSGNYVWAKAFVGTYGDYATGIGLDSSSNVYISGAYGDTVDFNPGAGTANITSAGEADYFLAKLDTDGNYVWAKSWGTTSYDEPLASYTDADGNSYVTGYYTGTIDFDPGAGTSNLTSAGSRDVFVSVFDASGNLVWVKGVGGTGQDMAEEITTDSDGNIYVTGTFNSTVDFDPGAGTSNLTSAGGTDIFVLALDSTGSYLWAKRAGSTSTDQGAGINIDSEGKVFVSGDFTGTVDFDPGAGTSNVVSAGFADAFVWKLQPLTAPVLATTSASLVSTESATLTSNITSAGGATVTERGFEYGTTGSYGSTVSESGSYSSGSYSLELTNLTCGTIYYVRSYAENSVGTGTGTGTSFTTSQCSSSGSGGGGGSSSDDGPLSENPTGFNSETCIGSSSTDSCVTQAEINNGAQVVSPNSNSSNQTSTGSTTQTFWRNLAYGFVGQDVYRLQQFLNDNGFVLADSGAGSKGNETTYYGPRTTNAVTCFQEYYKNQILAPLGLDEGTGIFGENTRSFVNSLLK